MSEGALLVDMGEERVRIALAIQDPWKASRAHVAIAVMCVAHFRGMPVLVNFVSLPGMLASGWVAVKCTIHLPFDVLERGEHVEVLRRVSLAIERESETLDIY